MNTTTENGEKEETLASKWGSLLIFIGFSALEVWVLIYGNLTFEKWRDWLFILGAFMFPLLALTSSHAITEDIRLQGTARKVAVFLKWILAAPFALIAVAVAIWLLSSVVGWFASIPGWAAVIIILLLLKR